ncbi:MAG: hypothetical protein V3W44_09870 [Dehalococcoidales bacterium]
MLEYWDIAIVVILVTIGFYGLQRCKRPPVWTEPAGVILTFKFPHTLKMGEYIRLTDNGRMCRVTNIPTATTAELNYTDIYKADVREV